MPDNALYLTRRMPAQSLDRDKLSHPFCRGCCSEQICNTDNASLCFQGNAMNVDLACIGLRDVHLESS